MGVNMKTTIAGILAVVPQIGSILTPLLSPVLANLLTAIAGAIAFYFAKDKDVTGAGPTATVVK